MRPTTRTGGVHDGDAAVAHGVQLVQAARLKPAGHEPDVGRRRQLVREVLVVALQQDSGSELMMVMDSVHDHVPHGHGQTQGLLTGQDRGFAFVPAFPHSNVIPVLRRAGICCTQGRHQFSRDGDRGSKRTTHARAFCW